MINCNWDQLKQNFCCESNNLWSAIRVVCSFLIGIVCICGDYISTKITTESLWILALTDNITHGLVGFFVALVILSYFHNQLTTFEIALPTGLAYVLSCILDFDHFIEARTIFIEEATSLSNRPFLHNTTIIIILFICVILFKRRNGISFRKLTLFISLTSVFVHHTRDAVRRGFWLYPFGSTGLLPYPIYILMSIIIPHIYYLVKIKTHQNYNILSINSNSFVV